MKVSTQGSKVSFAVRLAVAAVLGSTASAFADRTVTVDPSQNWLGYMNVFSLPADGGGYQFGSPWGTADLAAAFSATELKLTPNINIFNAVGYGDAYWFKPNGDGNKVMDANFYVEDDSLSGATTTFNGTAIANTLTTAHTSIAFIKEFTPTYGFVKQATVPLVTGQAFSLNLTTAVGNHVQYGFQTTGENANVANLAGFGSVRIGLASGGSTAKTWTGSAGDPTNTWSIAANWTGGVPNAVDAEALFGTAISSPTTINVNSAIKIGNLKFDNAANGYTVSGAGSLTLQSTTSSLVTVTNGGHSIQMNLNLADASTTFAISANTGLSVTRIVANTTPGQVVLKSGGGTLQTDKIEAGTFNIQGGLVQLKTAALPTNNASVLENLLMGNNGGPLGSRVYNSVLDVGTSDIIVRAGSLAEISDMARGGQSGATLFSGNGITSTTAQADANGQLRYAVGVIPNNFADSPIYATFDTVAVDSNAILVKFTYFGDADLSGAVDDTDFFLVNNGYLNGLTGWLNGDFDYSGVVDDTDFFLINNGYLNQGAGLRAGSGVPEPTGMGVMALGVGALLGRRRK